MSALLCCNLLKCVLLGVCWLLTCCCDRFGLLRPLDRFLIPIKHMLDLKVSMYAQPERPEEKALLVVDQVCNCPHVCAL